MPHDWVNADFHGTRGWFRCNRCGRSNHTPQMAGVEPEDFVLPPAEPTPISPESCEQLIDGEAADIVKQVQKILAKAGKYQPWNRPSETVRAAAVEQLKRFLGTQ